MTTTPQPGGTITWTQFTTPGAPGYDRTGTIWSGAPTGNGLVNAWWVHPDSPEPGETLAGGPTGVLCVGKASKHHYDYEAGPAKGQVYAGCYQAATLTEQAASGHARRAAERSAA